MIAAAAGAALLGEWADCSVILAIVLANALIGAWQENKAEGALHALARSIDSPVVVRRNQPAPVGFARARLESGQPFYVLLDPRRPERMLWVEIS